MESYFRLKKEEKFCQAPLNAEIQNRGIVKNIGI
jgi:hypothetical protein